MRRGAGRFLAALALLALGGAVGLAALAVYAWWWGLLLAAAASLAMVWALPRRWYALLPYAIGWWIPVAIGWLGRREGDWALAGSPLGYALIALGTVVLVSSAFLVTLYWPLPARARSDQLPDQQAGQQPEPGTAPRGAR